MSNLTPMRKKSLEAVLAELYRSNINCVINSAIPDGFDVRLGDVDGTMRAETIFSSQNLDGLSGWLIFQARKAYPKSAFAKIAWA